MSKEKKVLLIGSTAMLVTEFIVGFDIDRVAKYEDASVFFKNALSKYDDIDINHVPNHLVNNDFPQSIKELQRYDVVILTDCGRNNLEMYPEVNIVPMGPDRIAMLADYTLQGGSFIMAGGWKSFQGFRSSANYHGSRIEEVLPVDIQPWDDRVETTEGISPVIQDRNHSIFIGIPDSWPKFLGYNKVKPKIAAKVVATIGMDDPFIAYWAIEKGKSLVFTSGLAPHWGIDFVSWKYYGPFWRQVIDWMLRDVNK